MMDTIGDRISIGNHGSRRLWQWVLAALLVLAVWLLLGLPRLELLPVVRAVLVALVLFLLPGYLSQRALFPWRAWQGLNLLPVAFALSLGVGAVAWGGAWILGGSLTALTFLLGGACTALIIWNTLPTRAGRRPGMERAPALSPTNRQPVGPYLLVLGLILFWLFVALSRGALFKAEGDAWYYLAIVQRTVLGQSVAPGDPFFLGVADPQRGGAWTALVALLVHLSGVEAAVVWNALLVLLVPTAILAHYLVADTLFQDQWAAALSCLFLLYGFGRISWDDPMALVTPAGVGFILFLVALALAWRYVQEGDRRMLGLALLTAWALAGIHLLVFAGLLAALGSFALLHLIVHRRWLYLRRLLLLTVIPVLLAIPFLSAWTGSGPQTANPIYADEWGLLSEFAGWHVVRPSALLGGAPSPWAWAFLLSPALLVLARRHDWALFMLATMLFVVGTAFNPLFVEPLLRLRLIPPWGIWRLALQVFQFAFVLGGLGVVAVRWLDSGLRQEWGWSRPVRAAVLLGCAVLAFLPSAVPLARPLAAQLGGALHSLQHREEMFPFSWGEGIEFLRGELPPGSVILADANTSFYIAGLAGHYVVSIPYGHSSPFVHDDEQRRQDVAQALDPDTGLEQVRGILDRYRVDYVLLALVSPPVGEASLSPETYAQLIDRFEGDFVHFQRVFSDKVDPARQTAIFAYTPARSRD